MDVSLAVLINAFFPMLSSLLSLGILSSVSLLNMVKAKLPIWVIPAPNSILVILLLAAVHGWALKFAKSEIAPLPSIFRVVPSTNHLADVPQVPQTVTTQVSEILPSSVLAIISVVPIDTGVTCPFSTVATAVFLLSQTIFLSVALSG